MAKDANQGMEAGLAEALEEMDQGFLWLDESLIVRKHNQAYRRLLDLDEGDQFIGKPYREVLKFLFERGEFVNSGDRETFLADRLRTLKKGEAYRIERVRPNSTVLSMSATPLPSGGYVYTYLDITRERDALEKVRRNTKATVVAMANFAEHRDTDTGVHVLRVARLVGQTAQRLQRRGIYLPIVDDAFIEHVGISSMLHDVGKISTPDRVLLKAGPLTMGERETMQRHPAVGAQLLKQAHSMMGESRYLEMGAEIALTHHEWFDGTGYPAKLSGSDIPLSGRICAIADVFDALTSRRPYKAPWTTERAITQILSQSGTQFDPVIVAAFIEVIRERVVVSLVQWSESMSVGNPHIDEQHKILIDTINQLASAESLNDRPLVAMIIDELVSYTAFHFHFEERLMESGSYPHLEYHRGIHQGFVKWISDVRDEFIHQRRAQIGERILNYLRDWLREHILVEDQGYRPFINS